MSFPVVVLVSGEGSNLQAILDRLHGRGEVDVVGVGSSRAGVRALERATQAGVETAVFARGDYSSREQRDAAMGDWIEGRGAELVVSAGFMELLTPEFVRRFERRLVNVHPALLPAFQGLDAIGQAVAYGVKVAGVTVHYIDEGVDTGAIILQRSFELPYPRDIAAIEERVHQIEHELLPEAIRLIAQGRVRIDPSDPRWVIVDGD